jgi:hypothetical protein
MPPADAHERLPAPSFVSAPVPVALGHVTE